MFHLVSQPATISAYLNVLIFNIIETKHFYLFRFISLRLVVVLQSFTFFFLWFIHRYIVFNLLNSVKCIDTFFSNYDLLNYRPNSFFFKVIVTSLVEIKVERDTSYYTGCFFNQLVYSFNRICIIYFIDIIYRISRVM